MKKTTKEKIPILIFLAMLLALPASFALTSPFLNTENMEKRKFAEWPDYAKLAAVVPENLRKSNEMNGMETVCEPLEVIKVASGDYTRGIEAYYNDRIPYKNQLTSLNASLKNLSGIGQTLVDYYTYGVVIVGQDDWLFHNGAVNESTLPDYMCTNLYSKAELERLAAGYQKLSDQYKADGTEFVLFIPTNKEQVYPEYMPKSITKGQGQSRTDQLVDYLKQNTDVRVVYAKQTEIDQKSEDYKLWYKYDTHWNNLGAFVGEQALRQELQGESDLLSEHKIEDVNVAAPNDLAVVAGLGEQLQELTQPVVTDYKPDITSEMIAGENDQEALYMAFTSNAEDKRKFVMMRDSYAFNMIGPLTKDFADVTLFANNQMAKDFMEKNHTDIFVLEIVERQNHRVEEQYKELLND